MASTSTISSQISSRLFRTILIAWLLVAVIIGFGLYAFYQTDQAYSRAMQQTAALQTTSLDLNTAIAGEMLNTRAYLITGEEQAVTKRRLAHQDAARELEMLKTLLAEKPSLKTPSLSPLVQAHADYDRVAERLIELRQAGQSTQALDLFDRESDPLVLAIQKSSRSLQNEIQQSLLHSSQDYSRRTVQWTWLASVAFLAGTALSGIILIKLVSPQLQTLDFFEKSLVNSAETQVFQPVKVRAVSGEPQPYLFTAYNRLVERLTESSSTILKYVRFLHHEINSLLAAILGYGYMLADPTLRPEDASMEEYGKVIVQQSQRVIHLVEDFTLASRIDGGQFAPALIPVRLAPLLASLIDDLCEETRQEGAPRQIELHNCASSVVVLADALSLENAIRKIIENALKFSKDGTPVVVDLEVRPARPSAREERAVFIHVKDQGLGIPPEETANLFHPFSRIVNETTRHIAGNGLGLYLAAAIFRAHRGSISVQSEVGEGSTFTLRLPLEER